MTANHADLDVVTVLDPAEPTTRFNRWTAVGWASCTALSVLASVLAYFALDSAQFQKISTGTMLICLALLAAAWALAAVVFTATPRGAIRIVASPGDSLLSLVRRAQHAADTAAAAARLSGPAADDAAVWVNTLRTGVYRIAQAAQDAPRDGPARKGVIAELAPRVAAMEQVALRMEQTRWRAATDAPLAEVDAFLQGTEAALDRLEATEGSPSQQNAR